MELIKVCFDYYNPQTCLSEAAKTHKCKFLFRRTLLISSMLNAIVSIVNCFLCEPQQTNTTRCVQPRFVGKNKSQSC